MTARSGSGRVTGDAHGERSAWTQSPASRRGRQPRPRRWAAGAASSSGTASTIAAGLGVVVRVGHLGEPRLAQGDELGRRRASRKPHMVNATRRSWTTGARPKSEARFSATPRQPAMASSALDVAEAAAAGEHVVGQLEGVALVGARGAEARRRGAGRPSRSPGRSARHGSGRRGGDSYVAHRTSSSGLTGTYSGRPSAANATSRSREQAEDEGVDEGLPRRLDDVRARRRSWSTSRSPSVDSMSTRTTASVSALSSRTRTL